MTEVLIPTARNFVELTDAIVSAASELGEVRAAFRTGVESVLPAAFKALQNLPTEKIQEVAMETAGLTAHMTADQSGRYFVESLVLSLQRKMSSEVAK